MADLNEVLSKVMSTPGAMQQITALAQTLGLQDNAPAPAPNPKPQPIPFPAMSTSSGATLPQDPAVLMSMLLQMSGNMGGDDKLVALFGALKPFLRSDRAGRLDLAIQVARMSRLAGNTFQMMNSGKGR